MSGKIEENVVGELWMVEFLFQDAKAVGHGVSKVLLKLQITKDFSLRDNTMTLVFDCKTDDA